MVKFDMTLKEAKKWTDMYLASTAWSCGTDLILAWEGGLNPNYWLDCETMKDGWTWVNAMEESILSGIWLASSSSSGQWDGAMGLTPCPCIATLRPWVDGHSCCSVWTCLMLRYCWSCPSWPFLVCDECLSWPPGLGPATYCGSMR